MESADYIMVPRSAVNQLLVSLGTASITAIPVDYDPDTLLDEFELACRIDYRMDKATINERMRHARRLLGYLDKHPLEATRHDLRQFLISDPAQNAVKMLRVLYGRFFESDIASCFRVPQSQPRPVISPPREALRETYENLKTTKLQAAFLLLASSGLRRHELMELTWGQLDMENRIIYPNRHGCTTKFQWVTCFNDEAKAALERLFMIRSPSPDERIFTLYKDTLTRKMKKASPPEFKITPQVLRDWFDNEMGRLGVPDRYVNAFCGRMPRDVQGRHYTDYSPWRMKEIYDGVGLRVFSEDLIERARMREWR